jgi:hypothetical protein
MRKNPLFSWILSAVLGELKWLRKIRNQRSRKATIRDYPAWIKQVEERHHDTDSNTDLSIVEVEYKFLILLHLNEIHSESFEAQIQSLRIQENKNWELHLLLKEIPSDESSSTISQIDLPSNQVQTWNLD